MEEEEEPEVPAGAWTDSRWGKGVNLVFAIIGVVATVIGTAFGIYTFTKQPTTSLNATYQKGQFSIPAKLVSTDHVDSVIARRDTLLTQMYLLLRQRLTPMEQLALPDSVKPYGLRSAYSGMGPVASFANQYRFFYVLKVKNEGDKTLTGLHLLHRADGYYEYRDSDGTVKKGQSAGNLLIGDLAATEAREVSLWTSSSFSMGKPELTVTYAEGKVQAIPVTVEDIEIVEAKPEGWWWGELFFYTLIAFAILTLIQILKPIFTKK